MDLGFYLNLLTWGGFWGLICFGFFAGVGLALGGYSFCKKFNIITSKWKNKDVANNILRDFKVKVRHAGIKVTDKVTIHCLRKSWASNLANAGVPPHTLMKMGGCILAP